jgi:hypothetical protein
MSKHWHLGTEHSRYGFLRSMIIFVLSSAYSRLPFGVFRCTTVRGCDGRMPFIDPKPSDFLAFTILGSTLSLC